MRDIDIREVLLCSLEEEIVGETDSLIIEEMGLCQGDSRIDIAVINGFIHGYEIKSERDSLRRLKGQKDIYCQTLDFVTMVAAGKHIKKLKRLIPFWWGLSEAMVSQSSLSITEIRPAEFNPNVNPHAVVQLLWRDEALSVLRKLGLQKGMLNKPRSSIWDRITEELTVDEIRSLVRCKIKKRSCWRLARQQK